MEKWNDLLKLLSELVNDGVLSESTYYYYCSEFIKLVQHPYGEKI